MGRIIKALVILGVMVLLALIVGFGLLFFATGGDPVNWARVEILRMQLASRQDDLALAAGSDASPVRFQISTGDTPLIVARNLNNAGLILDAELFVNYLRVEGLDRELEAGTYFPNATLTIPQIARMLVDSRNSYIPFRILAGMRLEEVLALIDQNPLFSFSGAEFAAYVGSGAPLDEEMAARLGVPLGASLEGFLFPGDYELPLSISAEELRDLLIVRFLEATGPEWAEAARQQNLSIRDAVILASIIEREAVRKDEAPMIASVYRNRLAIGMKLDADPTVQYGLNGSRGSWWPQITLADYQNVNSPYNTYLRNGLPPGPIASPGMESLQAAVYPTTSEYFYFRARCDGSGYHNFSRTFEEHVANAC